MSSEIRLFKRIMLKNGVFTVPKDIRDELGWETGDAINFAAKRAPRDPKTGELVQVLQEAI